MGIKNEAVLAIFYCGLQSVKSFHIPSPRSLAELRRAKIGKVGRKSKFIRILRKGVPASCFRHPPLPMRRTATRCGSCCVCRRRRTARRCVTDSGRKFFHRFAARRVGILVRSSYFCKIEGAGRFRIRSTKRRNRYGIYKRGTGAYASCG